MRIDLSNNIDKVRKDLKRYQKQQLPKAITKALNRTLRGAITDTKKLVGKRINLSQAKISEELSKKFATGKSVGNAYQATMVVRGGYKRNLASFKGVRQLKRGGVSGKIWTANKKYKTGFLWERKIATGSVSKTAFMRDPDSRAKVTTQRGSYKNRKITRGPRAGQAVKRQPIKPIYGDSVVSIFSRKGRKQPVSVILQRILPNRFVKSFDHEVKRIR